MTAYAEVVSAARFPLGRAGAVLPSLDFKLTERCNNDCIHCCINQPAASPVRGRELSTNELQRILREAADLGCLHVRFTGGEPLLRDDFDDIYVYARKLGMSVLLFTNARLVTPQRADLFARIPPRVPIEVSVYGMRQQSYEAVSRCPGSFAEFRRGVGLLADRQVPFVLKTSVLPPNRRDLPEVETWASEINHRAQAPANMMFDFRHRRDDSARNVLIAALRAAPEAVLAHITRAPESYREEMKRFCSRFMGPRGADLFRCGACLSGCVDPYGALQPCLSLCAPDLACDLRQVSLRDALMKIFPAVRDTRTTNPEYLQRCARCFLHGLCEQCPARSWTETGTLDTPVQYYCEIAHAQARHLGLLAEGEKAWVVSNPTERVKALRET